MKVAELIEMLQECDPDANVLLMTQRGYPFEWSINGLAVREDFDSADEPDEDGDENYGTNFESMMKLGNDVFLLEGRQLCYGDKDAWNNPRNW